MVNRPKRLFKRYFVGNATFIKRVVHEKRKAKNNILHISPGPWISVGRNVLSNQLTTDSQGWVIEVHVTLHWIMEEKLAEEMGFNTIRILDVDSKTASYGIAPRSLLGVFQDHQRK